MKLTNTGDAIVDALLAHGVDTVFGLPGVQIYPLFDALQRAGERMKVYTPRHEQTTAYMAFGYAKSTGKVGVYTVVPGPGVLNTSAALCTAYGASTPVVCLTGQVPADYIGSGKGHVHELPDQLATLRTLTKWAGRIEHPAEAPAMVAEAFRQATSGRPRPVALEVPWDTLAMSAPVEAVAPAPQTTAIQPDPEQIAKAAKLLANAKNPIIMVGGGAVHAGEAVLALAELLQAPVTSHRSGRGIVSDEHYLGFNLAAGYKRMAEADVLVAIGSRLQLLWTGWGWPERFPNLQLVNIDIDPVQAVRLKPAVPIVGDALESTAELVRTLEGMAVRRPSRREEFESVKQAAWCEIQQIQPHVEYLKVIRQALPRNGFFVEEVCQAGFTSYYGFPVYAPRTYVTCGWQATLGFGFPTSLGVKVGNPKAPVVAIAGDGGFQFGLQELATAAQYGIAVVVIVFNNSSYGNVRRDQQQHFQGRFIGSELRNPNFVALSESFGVAGYRAETPAALQVVLEKALADAAPALIEVPIPRGTEASPWKFLKPQSR